MLLDRNLAKEFLKSNLEVDTKTGCWRFTGKKLNGYGVINISIYAHRLSLWAFEGLELDNPKLLGCHKVGCNYKDCINPEHLYQGDSSSNARDRWGGTLKKEKKHINKTTFNCGHQRSEDNSYSHGAYTSCKMCTKIKQKIRNHPTKIYVEGKGWVIMRRKRKVNG